LPELHPNVTTSGCVREAEGPRHAVEALGQDVDEDAADNLVRAERHGGVAARPFHALDLEGDARLVGGDQAAVGDGDALGVERHVGEHRLRAGEGALGATLLSDEAPPLVVGKFPVLL
jgi:hypothetical protein